MKILGLITEYNPFHNGHSYHIEQAKKMTKADYVIVVMSGNYVQRGVPAIFNKYTRTKMALECGADVVFELPVPYATGSAEYFATGAVSLLDSLGVVDSLCFGSESGKLKPFLIISKTLLEEPDSYQTILRDGLKLGKSYPAARADALLDYYSDASQPLLGFDLNSFLSAPNNILGLEYCKALRKLKSTIEPFTIKRIGSDYHDTALTASYSSATAIRKAIEADNDPQSLNLYMPLKAYDILINHLGISGPVLAEDFSLLLMYKLMEENSHSIQKYMDISSGLASRIYNRINDSIGFSSFTDILKTKELTYTRISRALLHVLLQITPDMIPPDVPYARILGFAKSSSQLLHLIKNSSKIPLLTKLSLPDAALSDQANQLLEKEVWVSNLYESVAAYKFKRSFTHELTQQIIVQE